MWKQISHNIKPAGNGWCTALTAKLETNYGSLFPEVYRAADYVLLFFTLDVVP
jgi:hypothetical protein